MLRFRLLLILLAALCCMTTANAAKYTLALPELAGVYDSSTPPDQSMPESRVASLDFGITFASIDSISITASGWNYAGLSPDNEPAVGGFSGRLSILMENPPTAPGPALLSPSFSEDLLLSRIRVGFDHDAAGHFSGTYYFFDGEQDGFYHLLDGKADLQLAYRTYCEIPFSTPWPAYPYGQLDSAYITIEGTAAPEPSGLALVLGGLASFGILRRRLIS